MLLDTNRKIKIAQVITRMDWGGSPDIARILCSYLDPDQYDVWLVTGETQHPSAKTREFLREFKDKIIFIPRLKRDIDLVSDFLAFTRLYFLFLRQKFDIVHTHTAKAGFLGRIAGRLSGVKKIIHTPHGNNFYGYFGKLGSRMTVILEKFADAFTDKWIVLTGLEKKDLIDYRVSLAKKIAVVNSGLELDKYEAGIDEAKKKKELGLAGDGRALVAFIGRLEEVKGPGYFIEAAKLVLEKFTPVRFLMVGEGMLKESLERQARDLSESGSFIFLGWREDVPEILKVLDVLVLSSLNEAVGRILLEAGACRVAVVAANVGGVAEIVQDGSTGILVRPKDSGELAEAIISLLRDKEKRLKLGHSAQELVFNKFSAKIMVKRIEEIYRDV